MGKPAARITDMHICPAVCPGPVPHVGGPILPPGATTVLIGGIPAARLSDKAQCSCAVDSIASGSSTVEIEGQRAARLGDSSSHGGSIVVGLTTVLIGDSGSGGGGGGGAQVATMIAAAVTGAPFCEACQANEDRGANVARQLASMVTAAQEGLPFCSECT